MQYAPQKDITQFKSASENCTEYNFDVFGFTIRADFHAYDQQPHNYRKKSEDNMRVFRRELFENSISIP